MGLVYFSDLISKPPAREKAYVADASFLISAFRAKDKREQEAKKLKEKLLTNKNKIVYIGINKSEIVHKSIEAICENYFRQANANKTLKKCWDNTSDRPKMKALLVEGYVTAFSEILGPKGEKLKQEVDGILSGCYHIDSSKMQPKPDWEDVYRICACYGLDSSDAMLLNFSISQKSFSGMISMDSDFRFCSDVPDFDIILPASVKNKNGPQTF